MDSQFGNIDQVPNPRTKYYYDNIDTENSNSDDNDTENDNYGLCNGWTYLMKLIMMSKSEPSTKIIDRIKNILLIDPSQVNIKNEHNWTPIMLACKWLNIYVLPECIKILIDAGASLNDKCIDGITPLMMLLQSKAPIEYVVLLLQSGADPNQRDPTGNTLLHYCACNVNNNKYYLEVSNILIKYGADTNAQNFFRKTPLIQVCSEYYSNLSDEFVNVLLLNGADVNVQDTNGNTALMTLYHRGRHVSSFIETISKYNLDINLTNLDGNTVLHIVCGNGYSKVNAIDDLIKFNPDLNVPNKISGKTPLMCAVIKNNIEHVKKLVSVGANIEICNRVNETVLFEAVSSYNHIITKILIDSNANVNCINYNNVPLIHYVFAKYIRYRFKISAYEQRRYGIVCDMINMLLDTDIDANVVHNNETVLIKLCKEYKKYGMSINIITNLIKISDLSIADDNGFTAYCHYIDQNDKVDDSIACMLRPNNNVKSARKI